MEGISHEAASLAGHLGLSKLICLYDDNEISIEGKTDITFTEDVAGRFKACNWHTIKVENGNDPEAVDAAIIEAKKSEDKPVLILLKTNIAFGSPNKQDSSDAHGAPLGEEEVKLTKKNLGWPEDSFFEVPEKVRAKFQEAVQKGADFENEWQNRFKSYTAEFPQLSNELVDGISGFLTFGWEKSLPVFTPEDTAIATRAASGKTLNAIAQKLPALIGGSADLAPSNKTFLDFSPEFQKSCYEGRNIRFGVREHAMGAIMAGMFLHGGVRPYGGTFLVFADYMRSAIRVASLMKLPLIYVFTHDSIAVGEDGPTHQPVEHLASLRAIPGLTVIRPGDATETVDAWKTALVTSDSPTAIILSRQKLPVSDRKNAEGSLSGGAYILKNTEQKPDVILIASGSEVHLAISATEKLSEKGINARVVSMPSWELFEKTDNNYKEWILPPDVKKRVVIEAGIAMGWEKYAGSEGLILSMEGFGESGPGSEILKKYGFSTENLVEKTIEYMKN
jgi:transketolase